MPAIKSEPGCLRDEALFEAAAGASLPPDEAAHLETCADCRECVGGLRVALGQAQEEVSATVDRALAEFRLPALPVRARPAPLWRWVAQPVPAYVMVAALLLALVPVTLLRQPGGPEIGGLKTIEPGGLKEVSSGVSAAELLNDLYNPDLRDAGQIRATITLLEEYSRSHPDDPSIHVKLVSLYQALLALRGWESAVLTRARAEQRLSEERAVVGTLLIREAEPAR